MPTTIPKPSMNSPHSLPVVSAKSGRKRKQEAEHPAKPRKYKDFDYLDGLLREMPSHLKAQVLAERNYRPSCSTTRWNSEKNSVNERKFFFYGTDHEVNVSRFTYYGNRQILVADRAHPGKGKCKPVILVRQGREWSKTKSSENGKVYREETYCIWPPKGGNPKLVATDFISSHEWKYGTVRSGETETHTEDSDESLQDDPTEEVAEEVNATTSEKISDLTDQKYSPTASQDVSQQLPLDTKIRPINTNNGLPNTEQLQIENAIPNVIPYKTSIKAEQLNAQDSMPSRQLGRSMKDPILLDDTALDTSTAGVSSEPLIALQKFPAETTIPNPTPRPDIDSTNRFMKGVRVQFLDQHADIKRTLPFSECRTSRDLRMAALAADSGNFRRKMFKVRVGEEAEERFMRSWHEDDFTLSVLEPLQAIIASQGADADDSSIGRSLVISVTGVDDADL